MKGPVLTTHHHLFRKPSLISSRRLARTIRQWERWAQTTGGKGHDWETQKGFF